MGAILAISEGVVVGIDYGYALVVGVFVSLDREVLTLRDAVAFIVGDTDEQEAERYASASLNVAGLHFEFVADAPQSFRFIGRRL
jgi:hypothetical protein